MAILTLTMNPCIDKSSSIENVVAERKLRCEEPVYEPGGGGVNVSRAIHKLGGTSMIIYLSGGPMGRMLDMVLDQEGIVCERMPIEGMTRENLIVYEKATGQQYRFGTVLADNTQMLRLTGELGFSVSRGQDAGEYHVSIDLEKI